MKLTVYGNVNGKTVEFKLDRNSYLKVHALSSNGATREIFIALDLAPDGSQQAYVSENDLTILELKDPVTVAIPPHRRTVINAALVNEEDPQ